MNNLNETRTVPFRCPVCNVNLRGYELFTHIYNDHEAFLATWMAVAFPAVDDLNTSNPITDLFRNLGINDDLRYEHDAFDDLSYEQLTSICDEIGYHKVGVKDIDSVAPAIVRLKKTKDEDRCPICLEDMHQAVYMRAIKECKHEFCGECIEEWLEKNKNCPICKLELEPQISSISESSSGGNIDLESLPPSSSELAPSSANVT